MGKARNCQRKKWIRQFIVMLKHNLRGDIICVVQGRMAPWQEIKMMKRSQTNWRAGRWIAWSLGVAAFWSCAALCRAEETKTDAAASAPAEEKPAGAPSAEKDAKSSDAK